MLKELSSVKATCLILINPDLAIDLGYVSHQSVGAQMSGINDLVCQFRALTELDPVYVSYQQLLHLLLIKKDCVFHVISDVILGLGNNFQYNVIKTSLRIKRDRKKLLFLRFKTSCMKDQEWWDLQARYPVEK